MIIQDLDELPFPAFHLKFMKIKKINFICKKNKITYCY